MTGVILDPTFPDNEAKPIPVATFQVQQVADSSAVLCVVDIGNGFRLEMVMEVVFDQQLLGAPDLRCQSLEPIVVPSLDQYRITAGEAGRALASVNRIDLLPNLTDPVSFDMNNDGHEDVFVFQAWHLSAGFLDGLAIITTPDETQIARALSCWETAVPILIFDITQDGLLDLLYCKYSGNSQTAYVLVTWNDGELRVIDDVRFDAIYDLDVDGQWEFIADGGPDWMNALERQLYYSCTAEHGWWQRYLKTIFRWNGTAFVDISDSFPCFYRQMLKRLGEDQPRTALDREDASKYRRSEQILQQMLETLANERY